MIISIHQPQYLPWLPFFLKADQSDIFILLDNVDFQKNGLQNRNQVKTSQGATWLTVPVKQNLGQKINEVKICNTNNWKKKHWQTIQQNYKRANHYSCYFSELEDIFFQNWDYLQELNVCLIKLMFRWLGIKKKILLSSEMNSNGSGSELLFNLCRESGAKLYISGMGGKNYLDEIAFKESGIEIRYQKPIVAEYPQVNMKVNFVGALSALDIILNCGKDWKKYLPSNYGV